MWFFKNLTKKGSEKVLDCKDDVIDLSTLLGMVQVDTHNCKMVYAEKKYSDVKRINTRLNVVVSRNTLHKLKILGTEDSDEHSILEIQSEFLTERVQPLIDQFYKDNSGRVIIFYSPDTYFKDYIGTGIHLFVEGNECWLEWNCSILEDVN